MAERVVIQAAPRTVLGKKVAQLRRNGRLPANVYGRGINSQAVDIDAREFARTIKSAGLRAMIQLSVEGESSPRYVILRGLARKGGTGDPIHVDFFQVDPNIPIQANVPLRLTGEAPAVRDLAGTLLPGLDVIAVRCKPLDIPDAITVDLGVLNSFDVSLTVGDIAVPGDVEVLTDPAVVIATVNAPRIRVAAH
ncbi:MAG: 50S ribosomal protein L25 [Dehalococcoidia bacterium]|jgi:large subunit ribosomal protein L25|uniref:50S ribosomal protein L25 n=1 Tax=Candidatus Amarobacter glycogenicus TaxID=3140699 RepID=UPI003135034F|nr:50S ribosomal protein L25 [Dehalococcoidia bacterium]MBK6560751.1 50S ribosomal protein L25 [Dehalococcoidia bacterium]MBK7329905.1 50S ribosomal protein L25 [Dehalococcoidia bacterium]MBK8559944.1 50S ribosomal protein L25 [Dehalococcoidia bacterium]MCC6267079.1 50S ribosomal protein L25 [Dehalococcoidia bacterium]